MSYFSNNLRFLREKKKLSQNKLGELANVNQTTIARWEKEEISPSLDNILDLADVLNVSIADLTGKDLTTNNPSDELEILFFKYKDILTDEDKEYIKFIIEKRKREIDKQLGDNNERT